MNILDYAWLEHVLARSLSSSSLVLVSKFTHQVRTLNGRVLRMRGPQLFLNMA